MDNIYFPNNKNTIVNFSCSILKHFNVSPTHSTITKIDEILKNHDKVVAILFDGMGTNILKKHLSPSGFMRRHAYIDIDAIFPPTTVASTNAFLAARFPNETGWLGWSQYFKRLNKSIDVFNNNVSGKNEKIVTSHGDLLINELCPYKDIGELINEASNDNHAYIIKEFPIDKDGFKNFNEVEKILTRLLSQSGKTFIYLYFTSPDHEMHDNGVNSYIVDKKIKEIENFVNKITSEHKDTLFLTFADHGLVNVKYIDLDRYKDINELCERKFSIEARAASFKIKKGKIKIFKEKFNKYFSKHYLLMSKRDVIKLKLFGDGENNPLFKDFIGDYIAISKDEYTFYYSSLVPNKSELLKAHHAGGSKQERQITICVFNK